jgi:hypothetical protein
MDYHFTLLVLRKDLDWKEILKRVKCLGCSSYEWR